MPPQIDFSKYGLANPTPTAGKIDFSKYGLNQPSVTPAPAISASRTADIETAQKYGATFTPSTENQGYGLGEAAKTVGNIPKSAFNFVKSSIDLMNPISTFGKVKQAISEFRGLAGEVGGYGNANEALNKEFLKATYEGLVPEAPRGIIKGVGGLITGNALAEKEGFEMAQRAITADPVGQIGIPLLIGRGIARKAGYGPQYDTAISKTAQVVTKPVGAVLTGAKNFIGGGAKFTAGQATGLQPETISQIIKKPEAFTKEAQGMIDRSSLGKQVQIVLGKKAATLSETGEAYAPIREGGSTVKVSSNWLNSTIKDLTKLDIKKGKIETSGSAILREASDVRAMQHLYDLWQPVFKKGAMTADEFLNFRTDLAKISKFERQIGKSQPLESMAKLTRGRFNESYRPQLEGLDILDKTFSAQTAELSRLSKGFVDRNGNLTDIAINRIANATGKGKDLMLNRLEETVPGITQKIKVLKAVEDIQNASGIKVGTYGRTAGTLGAGALGYAFGGPIGAGIGAIIESILTSPNLAVPILRKYGLIKNSNAVQTVVNALRSAGSTINQLQNRPPQILKKDIREIKTPAGMSIEDVSGKQFYHGTANEFEKFLTEKYGEGSGGDLWGKGVYLTDSADIAKGYAGVAAIEKGVAGEGVIMTPKMEGKINFFEPHNKVEFRNFIRKFAEEIKAKKPNEVTYADFLIKNSSKGIDFFSKDYWVNRKGNLWKTIDDKINGEKSFLRFMKARINDTITEHKGMTPGEYIRYSDADFSNYFAKKGYDGIKYEAGRVSNVPAPEGAHNYVVFDPSKITIEKPTAFSPKAPRDVATPKTAVFETGQPIKTPVVGGQSQPLAPKTNFGR